MDILLQLLYLDGYATAIVVLVWIYYCNCCIGINILLQLLYWDGYTTASVVLKMDIPLQLLYLDGYSCTEDGYTTVIVVSRIL